MQVIKQLIALISELVGHMPSVTNNYGEFCVKCNGRLTWEGQQQLRCLNPNCVDFNKPLINHVGDGPSGPSTVTEDGEP